NLARPITRPTFLSRPRIWTGRIVAITLIDLHLEHRLGMARIDTDHRQAEPLELGPQPRGRRSCLQTHPYSPSPLRPPKRSDRIRVGINHAFSHDGSRPAHHTDRCLLQRHVQSDIMFHRSSPSLRGHMRMASYVPGELIPWAFVWLSIPELPHVAKVSVE